nr:hypothetical protein [uncultured bacterium]
MGLGRRPAGPVQGPGSGHRGRAGRRTGHLGLPRGREGHRAARRGLHPPHPLRRGPLHGQTTQARPFRVRQTLDVLATGPRPHPHRLGLRRQAGRPRPEHHPAPHHATGPTRDRGAATARRLAESAAGQGNPPAGGRLRRGPDRSGTRTHGRPTGHPLRGLRPPGPALRRRSGATAALRRLGSRRPVPRRHRRRRRHLHVTTPHLPRHLRRRLPPAQHRGVLPALPELRLGPQTGRGVQHTPDLSHLWECTCTTCNGRPLDWLATLPTGLQAFRHSIEHLGLLRDELFTAGPLLPLAWHERCNAAAALHTEVRVELPDWRTPPFLNAWRHASTPSSSSLA